ncbi:hypothetical protein HDU67_009203, partial [Dinochytrium kinnereticum]
MTKGPECSDEKPHEAVVTFGADIVETARVKSAGLRKKKRGEIDTDGRIIDPKTFKYNQIRLDKRQYEEQVLKSQEERELDRDIEVAIRRQILEDASPRSRKMKRMKKPGNETRNNTPYPEFLSQYPVTMWKTALLYSEKPAPLMNAEHMLLKRLRPKSARPTRNSSFPVASDFSDFGSDGGGESDAEILSLIGGEENGLSVAASSSATATGSPTSKAASKQLSRTSITPQSGVVSVKRSQSIAKENINTGSGRQSGTGSLKDLLLSGEPAEASPEASPGLINSIQQLESNGQDSCYPESELRCEIDAELGNRESVVKETLHQQIVTKSESDEEICSVLQSRASSVASKNSAANKHSHTASNRATLIESLKTFEPSNETAGSHLHSIERSDEDTHTEHESAVRGHSDISQPQTKPGNTASDVGSKRVTASGSPMSKATSKLPSRTASSYLARVDSEKAAEDTNASDIRDKEAMTISGRQSLASKPQSRAASTVLKANEHVNRHEETGHSEHEQMHVMPNRSSVTESVTNLRGSNEPAERELPFGKLGHESEYEEPQPTSRGQSVISRPLTRTGSTIKQASRFTSKSGTGVISPASKVVSKHVSRTASAQFSENESPNVEAANDPQESDINDEAEKLLSRTQSLTLETQSRAASTVLKASDQERSDDDADHSEHDASGGKISLDNESTQDQVVTKSTSQKESISKPQSRATSVASRHSDAIGHIQDASVRDSVTGRTKNLQSSNEPLQASESVSRASVASNQRHDIMRPEFSHSDSEEKAILKEDDPLDIRETVVNGKPNDQGVTESGCSNALGSNPQSRGASIVSRNSHGDASSTELQEYRAPHSPSVVKSNIGMEGGSKTQSRAASVASRNSFGNAHLHRTSTHASVASSLRDITSEIEPSTATQPSSNEGGKEKVNEEYQSISRGQSVTSLSQTRRGSTSQKASGVASQTGTITSSPASKVASKQVSRTASNHLPLEDPEKVEAVEDLHKAHIEVEAAEERSLTQSLISKPESRATSVVLEASVHDSNHKDVTHHKLDRNQSVNESNAFMESQSHESSPEGSVIKSESQRDLTSKPQSRAASVASRQSNAKESIQGASLRGSVTGIVKNDEVSKEPEQTSRAASTSNIATDHQNEENSKKTPHSEDSVSVHDDNVIGSRASVNHEASYRESAAKSDSEKVNSNAQSRAGSVVGRNSLGTAHVNSTSTRASVTKSVNNISSSNEPETERNLASDEAGHETTHEERHSTSVIHD